jgi:transposase-like protein
LAKRHGINPKTVAKWKKRTAVGDLPTGPKDAKSTILTIEEEAIIVAFRRHTLLPLDDCLYALHGTILNLTRSSLHRCLQRHGISRLPEVTGDKEPKRKFKTYPIGYFHIDIAEVRTAEGKLYLYVAIDRTSKFAFVQLVTKTGRTSALAFLVALIATEGRGGNPVQAFISHKKAAYKHRNQIERCFGRLKHFRRSVTRYDRRTIHFTGFVHLAAAIIWLDECRSGLIA